MNARPALALALASALLAPACYEGSGDSHGSFTGPQVTSATQGSGDDTAATSSTGTAGETSTGGVTTLPATTSGTTTTGTTSTTSTTSGTTDDPCMEMGSCTTSTTSTTSGGDTGVMPPDDPCAGQGDGLYCGALLGGMADHGSLYQCMGGKTYSAQPCELGCEQNLCKKPASDPCANANSGNGDYCGSTLAGGDANALYTCVDGKTGNKKDCQNGCQVNPPGVPDACASSDLCMYASAGDGPYCGASLKPGEADNVLFQCKGKATESKQTCANGCQVNPPGVPDECKGGGGNNECCLQKPPGTLTQSYSACGQGGSHYGIDYGTAIGTPIYAGMAGTVVGLATGYPNCYNNGCSQSCWNAFNYVKIKSDCGDPNEGGKDFFIYYLHIDSLAPGIAKNVHVDQGQLVAYSGNSGCSSGPHIHIETVSVPAGQSASLSTCSSQNPAGHYCP